MSKPTVFRLGEDIKYNQDFYNNTFTRYFNVVPNTATNRSDFMAALKEGRFGNFSAIFRPHFQTGGEMGQWDEELISVLPPSVKIFASAGAGFNWADVDALGRRKIWYGDGAGASDDAVSDTALYMILSRKIHRDSSTPWGISHNPKGHTLGIVGLGNISSLLVRKAHAIGMKVIYYDVIRHSIEKEQDLKVQFAPTLKELLGASDCVSLHVPLNAHTRHLMNQESFGWMKPGARFINTSRGEVVEEEALVQALKVGKISAAGLDVHYNEPQVNKELAAMENVTLTTHCGGGALETRVNFELNAMENIIAVVADGGEPRTPVNTKADRAA